MRQNINPIELDKKFKHKIYIGSLSKRFFAKLSSGPAASILSIHFNIEEERKNVFL